MTVLLVALTAIGFIATMACVGHINRLHYRAIDEVNARSAPPDRLPAITNSWRRIHLQARHRKLYPDSDLWNLLRRCFVIFAVSGLLAAICFQLLLGNVRR